MCVSMGLCVKGSHRTEDTVMQLLKFIPSSVWVEFKSASY